MHEKTTELSTEQHIKVDINPTSTSTQTMEFFDHSIHNLLLARRFDEATYLLQSEGEKILSYLHQEPLPQYKECLTEREKALSKSIGMIMMFNIVPPISFFRALFELNPNFITKCKPDFNERYCSGFHSMNDMYNEFHGPIQCYINNFNFVASAPMEVSQQYLKNKTTVQEIVKLIILKNPDSLLIPSRPHDFLPLHVLLIKSIDSSSALTRMNNWWKEFLLWEPVDEEGAMDGDEQIRDAHNVHLNDFFQSIITTKPTSLILPSKGGVTCFELFWQAYATARSNHMFLGYENDDNLLLCPLAAETCYYNQQENGIARIARNYTKRIYPCIVTVIKTAFIGAKSITQLNRNHNQLDRDHVLSLSPLHQAIALPCSPLDMIQFLWNVHGDRESIDQYGNTPLHIAVGALWEENSSGTIIPQYIKSLQRNRNDSYDLVTSLLLSDENMASVRNNDGYYPLFIAIQRGFLTWDDGLDELCDVNSDIVREVDPVNEFYPYIYAAIEQNDTEHSDDELSERDRSINQLNIVYNLLHKCPEMVRFKIRA